MKRNFSPDHQCACGNTAHARRGKDWICTRCDRIERAGYRDATTGTREGIDAEWWEETDQMITDGMNRVLKRRKME